MADEEKPITAADLTSAFDKLAGTLASVVGAKPAPTETVTPKEPPRVYTRAELDALVEDGKITKEQADARIERQIEERITANVTSKVEGATLTEKVQGQIDGYFTKHADLNDKTSDTFKRVSAEFDSLVRNGSPKTVATELAALKIVFPEHRELGPGERFTETSPEVGTGGPRRGRPPADPNGPPDGLSDRQKQHYERGIAEGMYADWKAVREELKHAKPSIRTRAA